MVGRSQLLEKLFDVYEKMKSDQNKKIQYNTASSNDKEKVKLSHSMRKLLVLVYHKKQINQRSIALEMSISSQAVSEMIKKLETKGFVEKTNGLQNNENYIVLTPSGCERAIFYEERIKNHADNLLSELSDEEIKTMYELLDKIIQTKFKD